MPRTAGPRQTSLSLSLLKPGLTPALAIKSIATLQHYPVKDGTKKLGELYIAPVASNEPRWSRYVKPHVAGFPSLKNKNVSAVMLVDAGGRTFAVTFGYGLALLAKDVTEDRFGLTVTLNAVGASSIRTTSKKSLDAFAHHTHTQAIRAGRLPQFGVNLEQDLLQAVTGAPDDAALGVRLVGKDALGIVTRAALPDLPALLAKYVAEFGSKKYKTKYPEIDYIAEEQSAAVIKALDAELIKKIIAKDFDRLWLAVPEIIDWSGIAGFRYRENGTELYDDLHITEFLRHRRNLNTLTVDRLKQKRAYAVYSDGSRPADDWAVFRCIHFELDHGGSSFVLSGGRWFRLKPSFVKTVDDFVNPLLKAAHPFPKSSTTEDEGKYNKRVAKALAGHILADRDMIPHGGGHSKIEFCDLFNKKRHMVHVKRYGGSGVLSHLFAQGATAAELLLFDTDFRKKVRAKLPASHKSLVPTANLRAEDFEVVFGIVGRPVGTKSLSELLPFFSRVTLRRVTQRLKGAGFKVSVAWIPNK